MNVKPEKTAQNRAADEQALTFRHPVREDGKRVWELIASCPPLDENSLYCNLLQCTHFARTCILVERDGELLGWVSGYRPPDEPDVLFIWQVAVSAAARGLGLGKRMIAALLKAPACGEVRRIKTTITRNNDASWGLFRSVAASLNAPLSDEEFFERERDFGGRHDSEFLVTIGPFSSG